MAMFFKQRSNVLFRNYESFGYITDNRNFGYTLIGQVENNIGDKILSESGAVFFSVLERQPQAIEELAKRIEKKFMDVDIKTIENDAQEFYGILERDGFIISGESLERCNEKDVRFSYKNSIPKIKYKDSSIDSQHLEKSTQEFLQEHFKGKPQLTSLHLEITSRCNERCVHCYIPHDEKISQIEPNLFYNVLEQCKIMRILHLTLSGGEPMLHKDFCGFLRKCREYDFSVNVLSNLTLLNDEILNEMKSNPFLGVQVSLYSMNPDIHDEITQVKGSFSKTKHAILKLIENDIPLQISCPILKQNKDCYKDVIEWAEKHKIRVGDDFAIIARYNHTIENLNNRLAIHEIREVIEDKAINDMKYLEELKREAEKKKNISPEDFICIVCHSSICIADNGNVYPCAGWQDYIIGNVKETSLEDIWNNSEKAQYLRGLRRKDFPKCIQCPDKELCTMCMVRNANESPLGDPLEVNDYFCNIVRINKQALCNWQWEKRILNSA